MISRVENSDRYLVSPTKVEILDGNELNATQTSLTQQSYLKGSEFYAAVYEFSIEMSIRTREDYLRRFVELTYIGSKNPSTLVLGAGRGRDAIKLVHSGIDVCAIDYSSNIISNLSQYFVDQNNKSVSLDVIVSDLNSMFAKLKGRRFSSILAESCLQHINHQDVYSFFTDAFELLDEGGKILFRLKLSEHGKILKKTDGVGTRFYTTWTMEDIAQLKTFLAQLGYDHETYSSDEKEVPHRDAEAGMPGFYQLVVAKR